MNDEETYSPNFDHDFARGKEGEETVKKFFFGALKSEVKKDEKVAETGNFYIEEYQYHDALFRSDIRPSGINTTEAETWHWAGYRGGFWIETDYLKEVMGSKSYPVGTQPISNANTNASEGRLVPLEDILRALGFVK